jgi:DNA polymerase elongation subunit (family B)
VLQAISAKSLMKEGVEVSAGQTIQFLITNAESKRSFRRVLPAQLVKDKMRYDVGKYLELLLFSTQNILSPFGYTMDNLRAFLHEQKQKLL